MAKRFTDTELWDKEWFMELPCKLKCLVKFVRDKSDLSGVWSPNWIIANTYIGEKVCESDLLNIDNGKQFVKIDSGKIFCIGFVDFQYGTELSEKSPVHRKIISLLNQHGILENYQNIGYQYPINRVQDKDKEEVKDKVKVKEKSAKILFEDSEYYDIDVLDNALSRSKPPYTEAHVGYYHEAMNLWSKQGNKKIDWFSTCQSFILSDIANNKFKDKNFKPQQNGKKSTPKTNYPDNSTPYGDI